ncbi:MAG TPA: nucleotide disphospho-sugar-binding domain-containing protein [Chitinophagaceae bacterium]|nr:nucleotide disphospho-sugar-binding domain-containing protein [Chitinophagaceae bacterium]
MEKFKRIDANDIISSVKPGKKILFACVPADGHHNPLTGLAMHLKQKGCDVRWYGGKQYKEKTEALGIPYFSFRKAMEINPETFDQDFPERNKIKTVVGKLCFDMINVFILRGPEYYADIQEIHKEFQFDLMIADIAFSGIAFVKEKMNIPVIAISVFPLIETSKDLAPAGLGMIPATSFFGKRKQALLRFLSDRVLFRKPYIVMKNLLNSYGIEPDGNVFNTNVRKASLVLQIGSPGFEYKRSDLGKNIRFIGALLPYSKKRQQAPWYNKKVEQYKKVILVTQGTVERDINKLLVPTLEAFKNTNYLVIVTTGGSGTADLRARFNQPNVIIEDFIPFTEVMPYCDVYITNGGYGGVMLGIEHGLPLVGAGVHEGKNEINARIGYFKLGENLKTELPTAAQVRTAVEKVLADKTYQQNVQKLKRELQTYNPQLLCEQYVNELLKEKQYAATLN